MTPTDPQTQLDNDVAVLARIASDFSQEWAARAAEFKTAAPAVNTEKLDALVAEFQGMDTSWAGPTSPGQVAPSTASVTQGNPEGATPATPAITESPTPGATTPGATAPAPPAAPAPEPGATAPVTEPGATSTPQPGNTPPPA